MHELSPGSLGLAELEALYRSGEPFRIDDRAMADVAAASVEAGEELDEVGSVATTDLATHLGRKPQSLSPARDALLKKGLIYSGERGRIAFTVPHFGRYLRAQA